MTGQRIRTGVIGVGALGRHHARLLAEMPDVELVGVADPNPEQGSTVAELCGTSWFADHRTLLDQPGLQGVSVVVPTTLHRRIAEDCLQRGVSVLVEKPITPTVADGRALCDRARQTGLTLQVGHIERFNPAFVELARRTAAPRYVRAERYAPYSFRSTDISVVLDLMIHDLDLLLSLCSSPVRRIEALGLCVCGGLPDVVQARVAFDNGCIADLTASRVSPVVRRSFQCWSESGCWTADLQEQTLTGYGAGPALEAGQWPRELALAPGANVGDLKAQLFERFLSSQGPVVEKRNALQDELRDFLTAICTGAAPRVDGQAGVAALELATAISQSVDRHQWEGRPDGLVGPYAHPLHHRRHAA